MTDDAFTKHWIYLLIPTWMYLGYYEKNLFLMVFSFFFVGLFHFQRIQTVKSGIKKAKRQYGNNFEKMRKDEKKLIKPTMNAIISDVKILTITGICLLLGIYSIYLLGTKYMEDIVGFATFWTIVLAFLYAPIKAIQLGAHRHIIR